MKLQSHKTNNYWGGGGVLYSREYLSTNILYKNDKFSQKDRNMNFIQVDEYIKRRKEKYREVNIFEKKKKKKNTNLIRK